MGRSTSSSRPPAPRSVVFESMRALAKNGVLVLSSVTGGDKMIEVPADRINLEFVLGNKVMVGTVNANREYFEMGVKDMAHAESQYPGWLERLLTHPVKGLENWKLLLDTLTTAKGAIKVYCEVAEDRHLRPARRTTQYQAMIVIRHKETGATLLEIDADRSPAPTWKARCCSAPISRGADLGAPAPDRGPLSGRPPGALFDGADLRDADVTLANLAGASFRNAMITDARFQGSNMGGRCRRGPISSGADLTRCYLNFSNLTGCNFSDAVMRGADLTRCDLTGARSSVPTSPAPTSVTPPSGTRT